MDYGKAEQGCPLFLFKQCLDLCLIEFVFFIIIIIFLMFLKK